MTSQTPSKTSYLECFDTIGYKKITIHLYEDRVTILCQLNKDKPASSKLFIPSRKNTQQAYDEFIESYKQKGFVLVDMPGELQQTLPPEKRQPILGKRLTQKAFVEHYPDIDLGRWGSRFSLLDVYEEAVSLDVNIDLSDKDVFDGEVDKLFLKDLTVHGDIVNRDGETGQSLLVLGNTTAHSLIAGGACIELRGHTLLKDMLVMHYNDGSLKLGESLTARVLFDDDDHHYESPKKTKVDYFWSYDEPEKNRRNITAKHRLTAEGLYKAFPEAEWTEVEEDDYAGETYCVVITSTLAETVTDFTALCDSIEEKLTQT